MRSAGRWFTLARDRLAAMNDRLPPDASRAEILKRVAQVGQEFRGASWPYKAFLKARREYLAGGPKPQGRTVRQVQRIYDALPRDPVTGRPLI